MGANLKEVRERITTVRSTQQITKAMKMVSAAKLRRAQEAITKMRPYAKKLNEILRHILESEEGSDTSAYGVKRPVESVLIVVITSNRGLAGAFNSNIIKKAVRIADRYEAQRESGNLTFLCIGKKGYDYFRKRYKDAQIIKDYVELFNDLSFEGIREVPGSVMEGFSLLHYDVVHIAYSRFKSAGVQYAESVQYLPVPKLDQEVEEDTNRYRADYIFEPEKEELLKYLIPSILETQFHRFLLDTHAAEHGARMTAMDKATENAEELVKDLRIEYNKARQEAITREISEIVGGAAALEG